MSRTPNTEFGGWYQVRRDVFACLAFKCGTQSLKFSAFGSNNTQDVLTVRKQRLAAGKYDIGPFTPWEVARFRGRKVLGIRDPIRRFSSLWRDKCRDTNKTNHDVIRFVGGMTPYELIRFIESAPFCDPHFFPQSAYLIPDVELVRNDQIFRALELAPVKLNSRDGGEMPEIPEGLIRGHYSRDVYLWELVN